MEKPKFTKIDVDFFGMTLIDIYNSTSVLKDYNNIISKNYEELKNPLKDKNVILQTGLMLACYIGDFEAAKLLISEVGNVDLNE